MNKFKNVYSGGWQTWEEYYYIEIYEINPNRFFYYTREYTVFADSPYSNRGFLTLEEATDRIEEIALCEKEI